MQKTFCIVLLFLNLLTSNKLIAQESPTNDIHSIGDAIVINQANTLDNYSGKITVVGNAHIIEKQNQQTKSAGLIVRSSVKKNKIDNRKMISVLKKAQEVKIEKITSKETKEKLHLPNFPTTQISVNCLQDSFICSVQNNCNIFQKHFEISILEFSKYRDEFSQQKNNFSQRISTQRSGRAPPVFS